MVHTIALKRRDSLNRYIFILGLLFFLVRGQSSLYASTAISGDPITTTVELVLSDAPEHGFLFPSLVPLTPADGASLTAPGGVFHSSHDCRATHYDTYVRIVLKSREYAFVRQTRSTLFCLNRAIQQQSPDADPPLIRL